MVRLLIRTLSGFEARERAAQPKQDGENRGEAQNRDRGLMSQALRSAGVGAALRERNRNDASERPGRKHHARPRTREGKPADDSHEKYRGRGEQKRGPGSKPPAFQAICRGHLEPHTGKRKRNVKMSGEMVAVRKQPYCLAWVGDAVKAKLALRPLGYLYKAEEQR